MSKPGMRVIILLLLVGSASRAGEIPVPGAPELPVFVLPAVDGPMPVGVRSFSWLDESRTDTGLPGGKPGREIAVQIWYPAAGVSEGEPALYSPGLEEMLVAARELPPAKRKFVQAHEPLRNTATTSIPGASIAATAGAWPLVLFSPGGNVSRHWQTALAERIASRGFVFVSMSHPYSSIDIAPGSGFSMSLEWGLDVDDELAAAVADNRLADILAGDAAFVLAQLRALEEQRAAFAGAIDFDAIGIAGHSRGGKTVGRACASNAAFRACVVIDNIGPSRERETGVQLPFLTLRSPWSEARVAELHDYLGRNEVVAYDVEITESNHFTCTDLPLFMPDLRVAGMDPADGIDACATIISDFLDAYLRSDMQPDDTWQVPNEMTSVAIKRF